MSELRAEARFKRTSLLRVRPGDVHVEPEFNVRFEGAGLEGHIEALTVAIIDGAYIPPIVLRQLPDKRMVVRDGHCRLRAFKRAIGRGAEIEYIDAVEIRGNEIDDMVLMVSSSEGRPLEPIERAMAYKRLRNYGWSHAQIAKRFSKTPTNVADLLLLADAPHELQNLVVDGKFSAYAVINEMKSGNPDVIGTLRKAISVAKLRGKPKARPNDIIRVNGGVRTTVPLFAAKNRPTVLAIFNEIREHLSGQSGVQDGRVSIPMSCLTKLLELTASVKPARLQ